MAHRGGALDVPENTMRAFEYAVGLGYRYLETDVHLTSDGVLVAFHDEDLSRTCGRPGHISDLPWREVAAARVEGTDPIPRLVDLLDAWPDTRLNIDCKADSAVTALAETLRAADCLDRVCVGSFSDRRLTRLRRLLGSRLCTSLGPRGVAALVYGPRRRPPAHAAQVPVAQGRIRIVTPRVVDRAHRLGLQVHVWTVNDADQMSALLDLGVDGLITDRPAVLKDVLRSRGAWH
jgi:glycerophosphoryl diester phosphodiesterase